MERALKLEQGVDDHAMGEDRNLTYFLSSRDSMDMCAQLCVISVIYYAITIIMWYYTCRKNRIGGTGLKGLFGLGLEKVAWVRHASQASMQELI